MALYDLCAVSSEVAVGSKDFVGRDRWGLGGLDFILGLQKPQNGLLTISSISFFLLSISSLSGAVLGIEDTELDQGGKSLASRSLYGSVLSG